MVKFGERLQSLKRAGWEDKYVKYEQLKEIVSKIQNSATEEEQQQFSDQFAQLLSTDILQVNSFYLEQLEVARNEIEQIRLQNVSVATTQEDEEESQKVSTTTSLEQMLQETDKYGLDEDAKAVIQSMFDLLSGLEW